MHRQQRKHAKTPHILIRSLLDTGAAGALCRACLGCAQQSARLALRRCDLGRGQRLAGHAARLPVRRCWRRRQRPRTWPKRFSKPIHSALGLDKDLADLRMISTRHGLQSSHVVYPADPCWPAGLRRLPVGASRRGRPDPGAAQPHPARPAAGDGGASQISAVEAVQRAGRRSSSRRRAPTAPRRSWWCCRPGR